jgi:hypothetical protein
VPRWLSDVIVRCLAKKPADRYHTANHAVRALTMGRLSGPQDQISGDQVARAAGNDRTAVIPSGERQAARSSANVPTAPREPAGMTKGSRSNTGLIAVVVLVLLAAGAGAYWFLSRPVLVVQNRLVEPVQLVVPGEARQTLDPGKDLTIPVTDAMRGGSISWVLIRPTTPQGVAMGLEASGTIPVGTGRGKSNAVIDGRSIEPPAFAPLVSNAGTSAVGITINAGLAGAMSCNCVIPPGSNRVRIGYYPLYQNSTVRAEDPRRRQAAFGDLGPDVDQTNGTVGLRFEDKDFRQQ